MTSCAGVVFNCKAPTSLCLQHAWAGVTILPVILAEIAERAATARMSGCFVCACYAVCVEDSVAVAYGRMWWLTAQTMRG